MKAPSPSDKLIEALSTAFDKDSLEKILLKELDKRILEFVPQKELVSYVVKTAEAEGWVGPLIEATLKNKPNEPILKDIALLDSLQSVVNNPPQKGKASGGEVVRGVASLLQVLNQTPGTTMTPELFTALNGKLEDLYAEYKVQAAAVAPS